MLDDVIQIIRARRELGHQTVAYPDGPARFPERFRGRPAFDPSRCPESCSACAEACPTHAVVDPGRLTMAIDLGRCLFCPACSEVCPTQTLHFTRDYRLAMRHREGLLTHGNHPKLVEALSAPMQRLFGRSLRLRQVSAAGCNGCEAELNASNNIQFDLSRFGVQFVASPRHADGIVVTGPISENMRRALIKTWEAVPAPRMVIAVGTCACSGGVFQGSPVQSNGLPGVPELPVDLWIPGCPPHPITILDAILRLLGPVAGVRLQLASTGVVKVEPTSR